MPKGKKTKLGRPAMPVTLYNQETGKKKTWKTRELAAKEFGVSKQNIAQVACGVQKTVCGWGLTKPDLPHKKTGPRDIKENFQPIDHTLLEQWRAIAPSIYELQKKGGDTSCQFIRRIQDADIAECFGVQEININNHGADGRKDGEILFEHKNQSENNLDVTFQDTSLPKLEILCNGVLTIGTKWDGFLHKKYSVVFNTKNVGDIIKEGQKNFRQMVTIPLNTLLENGAKVIAWDNDPVSAWEDIHANNPYSKLTLLDIYGPADAKYVADLVMKTTEAELW